jgi:hypothetical protein
MSSQPKEQLVAIPSHSSIQPPHSPLVQPLVDEANIADDHQNGSNSNEEELSDESEWEMDEHGSHDTVAATAGTSTSTRKTKKKRIYPSDKNPFFGVIEGVGRGNTVLSKFCMHPVISLLTAGAGGQKWHEGASSKLSTLLRVCHRHDGGSFAEN